MENCWEQAPHSSQDYYPHYNLFQSSIFYDTDNFRVPCLLEDCVPSESCENEERSAEPPDKPPEPVVKPKRVVAKQELYRDPDLLGTEDGQSNSSGPEPSNSHPQPWGYDWTKQSWVKEGAQLVDALKEDRKTPENQPVAPRVNNVKAESMMHKMGWQGGALGKTGDGIVEPITPKAVHAFRPSPGPGPRPKKPGKATPNKKNQNMRDTFRTNILMLILEFVQDDTEVERHRGRLQCSSASCRGFMKRRHEADFMKRRHEAKTELLFDTSLRQHERRHITSIVNSVVNDEVVHSLSSTAQYELARDIHKNNKYLLECAQGENHQLGIYKEAPEDVYLVTPDDFLPKDDDDKTDDTVNNDKTVNDVKNGELEDDENPFLKSIKKSIKKDEEPLRDKFETDCVIAKESKGSAADRMMEFFLEFAETEGYKEMRFLGTFTDAQSTAINALLNDVCRDDCPAQLGRALRSGSYSVQCGAHGTPEIHKASASPARKLGKT